MHADAQRTTRKTLDIRLPDMIALGAVITTIALFLALPLIMSVSPGWLGTANWQALQPVFIIGAVAIAIGAIIKIFQ